MAHGARLDERVGWQHPGAQVLAHVACCGMFETSAAVGVKRASASAGSASWVFGCDLACSLAWGLIGEYATSHFGGQSIEETHSGEALGQISEDKSRLMGLS